MAFLYRSDLAPSGRRRPQDGRGKGQGVLGGRRLGQNYLLECMFGPGYGQGEGRGEGEGRKGIARTREKKNILGI